MRWLLAGLLVILVALQYRLWIAEGSLAEQQRLKQQVKDYILINEDLKARNAVLEREVLELQTGNEGIEQRAREELNLVREGETFYQLVDSEDLPAKAIVPVAADTAQESGQ